MQPQSHEQMGDTFFSQANSQVEHTPQHEQQQHQQQLQQQHDDTDEVLREFMLNPEELEAYQRKKLNDPALRESPFPPQPLVEPNLVDLSANRKRTAPGPSAGFSGASGSGGQPDSGHFWLGSGPKVTRRGGAGGGGAQPLYNSNSNMFMDLDTHHTLRYASQLEDQSKGGYINGTIALPAGFVGTVELSLGPNRAFKGIECHPHRLWATLGRRKRRDNTETEEIERAVISKTFWKVRINITPEGKAMVFGKDEVACLEDKHQHRLLHLGATNNELIKGLRLSIVKSLVQDSAARQDATHSKVHIKHVFEEIQNECGQTRFGDVKSVEEMVKLFKDKSNNLMDNVRLQVRLMGGNGHPLGEPAFSHPIELLGKGRGKPSRSESTSSFGAAALNSPEVITLDGDADSESSHPLGQDVLRLTQSAAAPANQESPVQAKLVNQGTGYTGENIRAQYPQLVPRPQIQQHPPQQQQHQYPAPMALNGGAMEPQHLAAASTSPTNRAMAVATTNQNDVFVALDANGWRDPLHQNKQQQQQQQQHEQLLQQQQQQQQLQQLHQAQQQPPHKTRKEQEQMNEFSKEEIWEAFKKKEAMIHIRGRLVPFEVLMENLQISEELDNGDGRAGSSLQPSGVTIKLRVGQQYD